MNDVSPPIDPGPPMSETRAAAQLRQQIALGKFGEIALTSDNLDHILTEACRLVADAVGTELAKVMELQKAGKIVLVRAGVGWKKGIVGKLRIKATDNTSEGHALRTGNPMISPDIALETRFTYPPFLTDNGVQAVANVVIIGGLNRPPFGILQVDSREPRNFSEEDIVFLQSYANLVAAAVDRFRVESARLTTEKTARLAGEKAGILRAEHDSAIAANLSKSRFLAAASHDLRQPLHALGLFLHVLKSGLSPAQTKVADQMTIAVASMQRMFNGLLDVVRLDAGMMASRPQTFPLQSMFDTLQTSFAASAEAKGLVLELHPTSLSVTIDPVMLESILQNLMSNAISYTVYGKVTVAAHENADGIAVEVHDTGRGIPQDRLVDIFEEFVRLDRGGASENGIGLGLAIVHRQATELGATIDVRSTVGVGSTFTLNLPIVERISEQPTTQQKQQQLSSLVGKRILLVEDNKPILSAMVMQAENWGARPLPAASADEAMSLLTLMMPESPDAAVVDLDLGDKVTGIELLTQIEEKFGIAIPAVIVTGSTTAGTMERINASGHPWLAKPTDPGALYEALVRRIASVVGRGALSQRPRS